MGRTNSSRQRLLSAASELLWEKSYHSVTVDEVCALASVRKGSLYHFFDSKSALTVAVLQHLWETVADPAYEKHFSLTNPPLTRITNFLDWLQRLQREKYRAWCAPRAASSSVRRQHQIFFRPEYSQCQRTAIHFGCSPIHCAM